MTIINLTQHPASPEQVDAGVVEPQNKGEVKSLLTFTDLPSAEEVNRRAKRLAVLAVGEGADSAMIGGAPFLMGALERALKLNGIEPLFAFSRRESVEETLPNGEIVKRSVFRHLGFVEA